VQLSVQLCRDGFGGLLGDQQPGGDQGGGVASGWQVVSGGGGGRPERGQPADLFTQPLDRGAGKPGADCPVGDQQQRPAGLGGPGGGGDGGGVDRPGPQDQPVGGRRVLRVDGGGWQLCGGVAGQVAELGVDPVQPGLFQPVGGGLPQSAVVERFG
jgi:hypothetical protein